MGSPTIPMFGPDGTLGDVPMTQANAAKAAGAKPAVNFQAPDGTHGYVPADKIQDAIKAGGKILPFEQQEMQHPGFWHSMVSDLAGMVTGLPKAAAMLAPPTPYGGGVGTPTLAQPPGPAPKGSGTLYRAARVPASLVANVPGMEQSAAEGDVAGVAGHAAAPVAAAALGTGASEALRAVGPWAKRAALLGRTPAEAYQSALKPSTTLNPAERARIVNTGLTQGIPVSKAGLEMITDRIDALNQAIKQTIDTGNAQGVAVAPAAVAQRGIPPVRARFANQVTPESDLAAINATQQEFLRNNPNPIPAAKAQAMKQGTYRVLRGKYGEQGSAAVEAQKGLAFGLKEELAHQFPEIRGPNAQESALLELQPALERAVGRISNHQLAGIGTPIAAGAAKAVTGSASAGIVAGLMKAVLDDPVVKSKLAIALRRSGVRGSIADSRIAGYGAALAQAAKSQASNQPEPAQ